MPAGRPTRPTPDDLAKLEVAFAWGCSDREACLWADMAPATLYNYQAKHPEFIERKEALKETPVMLARKTVLRGVQRDPKLALDLLSRKKKDEYSLRSELTGKDGDALVPLPILGGASKDGDALRTNDGNQEAA